MNQILPLVSVIVIDYKKKNPYLIECLEAIEKQTYKNFEIILVCDFHVDLDYPKLRQKSYGHYVGPAEKRDAGAKMAKGEILAFIDDDAFPCEGWLAGLVPHFQKAKVAGVGGPGVTPPGVSWQEEASGWASASPVGAGPYTYRFLPGKKQYVDDYPSMNLAVRRFDFMKVGGYDSNFWPGEDTKLCLDLTHKLNKQIIYEPKAIVFHHRRPILLPHLRQNGNFGLHRGFFARILPETSLRLIYFLPSLLLLGSIFMVISSFPLVPITKNLAPITLLRSIGFYSFSLYFFVLFLNSLWVLNKSKNVFQSLLSIPVIFITHLWYGVRFLQGFLFTAKLIQ
ncbi:MAG: hypothetical protein UW64_C0003G0030 [Microgenomates group bacterium GW2011_GWC1_44_37]|uniref:Glycosyltransferase 2-like domain-containing protein n=1 Tax=Candidatus Collierbacteria bacterium GW2011_GWB2_44_22 TaxID=1618387 RepID=A0A0G1K868_9BACT|nr:MAG: hypothetical protein UW31_C0005G0029 [Candidatus Collierbacteria bacterium GW2011_GWA2_44_13]KKT52477.1 MAG: hypothetical protein UW44_C0001G0029 [Candidatus Collierbacteria bacterium GW2011_GWB2_44_22]KKT62700.1 MAG: hypothetical protein UW56_C0004G0013 [Candidatus Collierbacteria bacterium GW2011_GWD1_44_27]KKT65548.1 MAG: hypothetical protein UW58_C0027G0030 [Candidatus Collierbacteria bacterium GW2011_GWC2_44_30]KKT69180.1 MAG: hypothetical protein UW64_C0003G0030 [Microgenomates gr